MLQKPFLQIRIALSICNPKTHIVISNYHKISTAGYLKENNGTIVVFQIPIMLKKECLAVFPDFLDLLGSRYFFHGQHCHLDIVFGIQLSQLLLQILLLLSCHELSFVMNHRKILGAVLSCCYRYQQHKQGKNCQYFLIHRLILPANLSAHTKCICQYSRLKVGLSTLPKPQRASLSSHPLAGSLPWCRSGHSS